MLSEDGHSVSFVLPLQTAINGECGVGAQKEKTSICLRKLASGKSLSPNLKWWSY